MISSFLFKASRSKSSAPCRQCWSVKLEPSMDRKSYEDSNACQTEGPLRVAFLSLPSLLHTSLPSRMTSSDSQPGSALSKYRVHSSYGHGSHNMYDIRISAISIAFIPCWL